MAEPAEIAAPKLAFIKFVVPDLDAAERFYAEAFGLKRLREIPTPDFVERVLAGAPDGMSLIILAWNDGRAITPGNTHGPLGIYVDDIDAAITRCTTAGGKLLRGPFAMPVMRIAFVESPQGHEIELLQRIAQ